ncbi:MAG: hypothetical protein AAGF44_07910 [Pseudomonadota bacterium]
MGKLDKSFERLSRALDRLEEKLEEVAGQDAATVAGQDQIPGQDHVLKAERDVLAAKVARLQARSAEEAQLRGEAADAVRAALSDLRAMASQAGHLGGMHG